MKQMLKLKKQVSEQSSKPKPSESAAYEAKEWELKLVWLENDKKRIEEKHMRIIEALKRELDSTKDNLSAKQSEIEKLIVYKRQSERLSENIS